MTDGLAWAIRAEGDRLEVAGLLDDREAVALAAAVRVHLAALAADEQVRERVAEAIYEDEKRIAGPERAAVAYAPTLAEDVLANYSRSAADAAVAAFLAAAEEERP